MLATMQENSYGTMQPGLSPPPRISLKNWTRRKTLEDFQFDGAFDTRSDDFYDITRSRVLRVFQEFDVDDDGNMTSDEFRRALRTMGVGLVDSEFTALVDTVCGAGLSTSSYPYRISFPQFEFAVQVPELDLPLYLLSTFLILAHVWSLKHAPLFHTASSPGPVVQKKGKCKLKRVHEQLL